MRMRIWIALAFSVLFFIACVWSKPEAKPPVAPEPNPAEHSFLSAIRDGTTDGINRHVRENLWKKKPEGQKGQH